ncbi:hypothetical protein CORC01_02312 [Colletotrichum orchidophilum]|uniref:Uncharacterized protein n=1 Tax=Colletotrichum orchidophilum TaxID=1209926 RepID=A0A1G4BLI2_9PEZI|nr:uncharacterized protein CORC01_02312 [Colletotrichum orchidophilum]OHF02319.1 hypothetical protein CORC01_02312 [Colletotrichum orchidophilum]
MGSDGAFLAPFEPLEERGETTPFSLLIASLRLGNGAAGVDGRAWGQTETDDDDDDDAVICAVGQSPGANVSRAEVTGTDAVRVAARGNCQPLSSQVNASHDTCRMADGGGLAVMGLGVRRRCFQ